MRKAACSQGPARRVQTTARGLRAVEGGVAPERPGAEPVPFWGRRAEPVELRPLDPTRDLDRLRAFLRDADPEDYLLEGTEEWIAEGRSWVVEDRGAWIGFGRLHDLGESEGWLSGLRVAPARRREGVGRRLLDRLLEDAASIGISTHRAVIEDGNAASRGLFEGLGFRSKVVLTLRRGYARSPVRKEPAWRLAAPDERPHGAIGWLPAACGRVDLLPGSDAGRFGRWRDSLPARWASERKLYLSDDLAVAAQIDWWPRPRTLWVNPLVGEVGRLLPALGSLAGALGHAEWQAFLPADPAARVAYAAAGAVPNPHWGNRAHLYERADG